MKNKNEKNEKKKKNQSLENGMRKFWTDYNLKNKSNIKNTAIRGQTANSESTNSAKDGDIEMRLSADISAPKLSKTNIGVSYIQTWIRKSGSDTCKDT